MAGQQDTFESVVLRMEELREENARLRKMADWHAILEDRWRKFEFIANSSNDFMTLINRHYIYEAVNTSYLTTIQQTEARVIGRTVAEIWGEEAFERDIKPHLDACFSGDQVHYQAWFDFHDRGRGYYDVSYYPYYDEHDEVSHAAVISHDVTGHKRAAEALRESEERYRTVLQSYPDPIAVLDMEGRATCLNEAFERVFGRPGEDCLGERLEWLVPRELRHEEEEIRRSIEAGEIVCGLETSRLDHKGREVPVTIGGSAYLDSDRKRLGSVITWRDISGRKRLEAQLLHAQKMEAIGTLASGIAHDFNNILQAISGYIELMLDQDRPDPAQLSEVDLAVKRASDLVKRLLSFSRKDDSDLRLVDMNQEINQAVRMLERTLPKMIDIRTELNIDFPIVQGDARQLEQVFLNLGSNGADAMPEGGRLTISTGTIEAPQENGLPVAPADQPWIEIRVSDTGGGIDPEVVDRIFEPFFTTKDVGRGTGLGLSIVYTIVNDHGGRVKCLSRPGDGATFVIQLPMAFDTADSVTEAVNSDTGGTAGQETVLVVDDEEAIVEIASEVLTTQGYRVLTADTGEAALDIFRRDHKQIDLVIMDLGMPGMGGQACMKLMIELDPLVPVMVASGYASAENVRQSMEAGACGFVPKPYRLTDLLSHVRRILDSAPDRT